MITCSREVNADYFYATCGGMGLTGIILSATIQLKKIANDQIEQNVLKATHIKELIDLTEANLNADYSVAWLDATKPNKTRGLLLLGEHSQHAEKIKPQPPSKRSLPIKSMRFLLNKSAMRFFNRLYYYKSHHKTCSLNQYFYPLDRFENWNLIYGPKGFVQYQFVLPLAASLEGMQAVIKTIHQYQQMPYLAVLKRMGKQNNNLLSFPIEGYTLALDFKVTAGLFDLIKELDAIVLNYGGRLYLAKDALLSAKSFRKMYPMTNEFKAFREKTGADKIFHSFQSKRLEL